MGAATASLLLLFLAGSWYPFVPDPPMRISNAAVSTDTGVRFTPVGLALPAGGRDWVEDVDGRWPLHIHLTLRSGSLEQARMARILTLGDDLRNQALIVAQDGADLVIRSIQSADGRSSSQSVRAKGVVEPTRWQDVEVVLTAASVTIIVDEGERARGTFPDIRDRIGLSTQLALGAEPSGQRAWRGELAAARLVAGERRLDLLASDELEIPASLWKLPDRLDETGMRPHHDELRTAAGHLALSIAIGMGVALWRGRASTPIATMLLWACLAAAVNLGKVGFAFRHPSLATTLLHIAGGWLGITLGTVLIRAWRTNRRHET